MQKTQKQFRYRALAAVLIGSFGCTEAIADFENDNPSSWNWPFPFILSGDESIENDTCVVMSNSPSWFFRLYRIMVSDNDSNGFVLEQYSPNTSGRLPVQFTWQDPSQGSYLLTDNVEAGVWFTGPSTGNCSSPSRLTATISQFDYLSVEAGSYYEAFPIRARGLLTGDLNSYIYMDVTVPEFVRVSFPNGDIAIPFSTSVDQLVVEQFCIYTNAANGSVGVAVDVLNNDVDGNHSVLDNGFDQIEYSFELRTAGGAVTLGSIDTENGMAEVLTTNADTQSNICAVSGNTHELAVLVKAADMAAAPAGSYSDTIMVYVEPAL